MYIARAHAKQGKLLAARADYQRLTSERLAADVPAVFRSAQAEGASELAAIEPRIPRLRIVVHGVPDGATVHVEVDGAAIAPAQLAEPIMLDPTEHTVIASLNGVMGTSQHVVLVEGSTIREVVFELGPPAAPVVAAPSAAPGPDTPVEPVARTLSHRGQPGAVVRLDIDPLHAPHQGALVAPGLTYGVVDWLEVGAVALLGKNGKGLEPDVTFLILNGAWKPLVNVGVPIFLSDGASVGVRGAAGLQWDAVRHFGVFAQVGGAFVPNAPDGYAKAMFLPSVGLQGRI